MGRYSDAYKTDEQQAAWERSIELFEKEQPMDAYRSFFAYLKDPKQDNLAWSDEGNALHFEFWQGSRRITGTADGSLFKSESRVAHADDLNVGYMRRMMERNFSLRFSRFALTPDNHLVLVFDTPTSEGAPMKLLAALKELSINADKQDDLLLDEFKMLSPADERTGTPIPDEEKEIKYQYLRQEIEKALAIVTRAKPDPNQYPGGYAYLLLGLAFRLDYLLRPEGVTMDVLERIQGIYFAKDEKTPQLKILNIVKEFQKLLDRPKESFFQEMYRTRSTFGISPAVTQDRIQGLVEGELGKMEWHLGQKHEELAAAVPGYITGFALFHYAPPLPIRSLLETYYRITEEPFFRQLGWKDTLTTPEGLPDKKAVVQALASLVEQHRVKFPKCSIDLKQLDFSSAAAFGKTYLEMTATAKF